MLLALRPQVGLTESLQRVTGNVVPSHLQLHYALVVLKGLQHGPASQQTDIVPPQI